MTTQAQHATGPAPAPSAGADPLARAVSPYTMREKAMRLLWNYFGQTLMRLTFHSWYGPRASLLRFFGARIGPDCRVRSTVKIEQPWNLTIGRNSSIGDYSIIYCLGKVVIGNNVSLSQYVHLCAGTHDYTRTDLPLLRPPITIGDEVWLAADVFVGPDVTIGRGSVVGARASVLKSLPEWKVCAGTPARPIKDRVLAPGPSGGGRAG